MSPDCPPEPCPVSSSNAAFSRALPRRVTFPRAGLAGASAALERVAAFFLAVSLLGDLFFDVPVFALTFLTEVGLDFIAFLAFFLVAIFAV